MMCFVGESVHFVELNIMCVLV